METVNGRTLTPARGTLLRIQRSPKIATAAITAAVAAFAATLAIDPLVARAGAVTRGLALLAALLALVMAVRTCAAYWRGPELMHFPVEYAVLCHGAEAAGVRAVAALRGPLGGAGFVHRGRLVLPLFAWLGVSAVLAYGAIGGEMLDWRDGLELLVPFVAARVAFPARPFWYREHRDGAVVLYPASVAGRVCPAQE